MDLHVFCTILQGKALSRGNGGGDPLRRRRRADGVENEDRPAATA
jgi:hypothetical protein